MIVIFIIGVIATAVFTSLRKEDYQTKAYKKAVANYYLHLNLATKQILAHYSYGYNMTTLYTTAKAKFSITDSENADTNLAAIYKKMLGASSSYSASDTYKNTVIKNEAGTAVGPSNGYKISDFTQGFKTKNGYYVAFKLNKNCTTTEQYVYDPSLPDKRTATNSCGLILYDVSADRGPNLAGADIYILPIYKMGIK